MLERKGIVKWVQDQVIELTVVFGKPQLTDVWGRRFGLNEVERSQAVGEAHKAAGQWLDNEGRVDEARQARLHAYDATKHIHTASDAKMLRNLRTLKDI